MEELKADKEQMIAMMKANHEGMKDIYSVGSLRWKQISFPKCCFLVN
jgi:hypothetical protein